MRTQNIVDFSEIFRFADNRFGIDWNTCCDIFHRTEILAYPGSTELYLFDMKYDLKQGFSHCGDKKDQFKQAYEVLIAFMEKENVDEMLVLCRN